MKNETKIKYLAEILAFIFIFLVLVSPVLASEITPNKVIKLVNSAREKEGLRPLVQSEILMQVAQDKLDDMIKNEYFSHTSPSGKTPWSWFAEDGYDYQYAGENLAINFTSAEAQQEAWMKSPTHRKNILNVDYQEIGVAFGAGEINGKMSLITVQEFGVRAIAPETPQNGNNFLMQKGLDLLENGGKIMPQVLAVKTKSSNNSTNDGSGIDLTNFWSDAYVFLSIAVFLLFMSSIFLLPVSFLAVAFDRIHILLESKPHLKKI